MMDWQEKLSNFSAGCRTFLAGCRQWIWPSMGWRRFIRYQFIKLSRMTGGKKSIAKGFASGAAVSFTPFIGLHFIFAGLLAKVLRGNIVAAMIGTAVGNPWTFPFIWFASYRLGLSILDWDKHDDYDFDQELSITTLLSNPLDIFLPMLIGSLPLVLIVWPIAYYIGLRGLNLQQKNRKKIAK